TQAVERTFGPLIPGQPGERKPAETAAATKDSVWHNEPERWSQCTDLAHGLKVAADRFGQLAVFDGYGTLVCMFIAFRNRLAGWLPDGTYFGTPMMTRSAESHDAAAKFGQALLRATSAQGNRR